MALPSTFQLEFDDPIEIPVDAPGVPEKIARFLGSKLKGLKRIVVSHEQAKLRWKKINGFKLDGTPGKATTADPDDIAMACMIAIAHHFASLQRGDEQTGAQNYRVMCHLHEGQGDTARPSVEYVYNPSGDEQEWIDPIGSRDAQETRADQLLTRLEAQNSALFGTIKELIDKNNAIAGTTQQALQPFAQMFGFMTSVWHTGAVMQQNALHAMYSAKRDEIEATHTDRRIDKLFELIKGPIGVVLKSKYGVDISELEDDDDDDDDDDEAPKPRPKRDAPARPIWDGSSRDDAAEPSSESVAQTEKSEPADDEIDVSPRRETSQQQPVALFANELGRTIRPTQWLVLSKHLDARELDLLVRFFESRKDAALVKRYDAIFTGGAIPLEKLLKIQGLLTPEQRKNLTTLQKLVERVKDGWK